MIALRSSLNPYEHARHGTQLAGAHVDSVGPADLCVHCRGAGVVTHIDSKGVERLVVCPVCHRADASRPAHFDAPYYRFLDQLRWGR